MSKIVGSGRYVVAIFLAAKGFGLVYEIVLHFSHARRDSTIVTYPADYLTLVLIGVYWACAWGLLKWRKWAYTAGIAISLLELAVFAAMVGMDWSAALQRSIVLWSAFNCAVLTWFVLPPVRSNYQQRQQVA